MSTKKYKVSSFSIIFKAEEFIQGLIENIIEQEDFENIEFIFLNPNSPDNSKKIIEPYLGKYTNLKLIDLDNDPGLYACWNICVKNCSADLITNWNPDDRRTKDSIKSLANQLLINDNFDLSYGLTYVTRNKNEPVEECKSQTVFPAENFSFKNLFFNNSPHCMPMWKKIIHEKYGYFDESYISAGDGEMWLRAAINGSNFIFLKKIVGSYYESNYTVSRNKEKLHALVTEVFEMRCKILKKLMRLE